MQTATVEEVARVHRVDHRGLIVVLKRPVGALVVFFDGRQRVVEVRFRFFRIEVGAIGWLLARPNQTDRRLGELRGVGAILEIGVGGAQLAGEVEREVKALRV